ncbi:probable serine/threonine-protein kinase PIX13 [Rhododendron vialii]|uniref:probable serine/threonine-protein kinase PIX13 n=1 Tax=Rhododendron vialii TaxID=182163 RepID=UPI002660105A|nr:probable serine/threonine-protein kinase PIX13 [Rhododendron vialii]
MVCLYAWGSAVKPLPWDIRLKILIGAAQGLAFLLAIGPIICREFKASNILLDESFNSKISDFSYAELDSPEERHWHETRWPGTHPVYKPYIAPYNAPEYAFTGNP